MRKEFLTAGLLLSSSLMFAQGLGIETENIAVDDFFRNETDLPGVRKLNSGSKILVTYVGDWPEEMKGAFEYAVKIWEENLPMNLPINIRATLPDSMSGRRVLSTVKMNSHEFPNYGVNETLYPMPLVKYVSLREHTLYNSLHTFAHVDNLTGYFDTPDIEITYNRDMLDEFSFNIDVKSENKYDFVTLALRDIAMGLGFNNRYLADTDSGELLIPSEPRTPFEQKIFSALGSPTDLSAAYGNATKGSLNVGWGVSLYAPNPFKNGESLRYTVADDGMPLSDLLAYDFPKGYVMRDISNYDWTGFFSAMMGWKRDIITGNQSSNIDENISDEIVIPYQGEFNFSFSEPDALFARIEEKQNLKTETDSIDIPYVSIGEYCEPYYLGRDQTGLRELGNIPMLIVSVQKKDGSWETLSSHYVSGSDSVPLRLDTITLKEPQENYARSTTGNLKYRFVQKIHNTMGYLNSYDYKVQYLTRDYLPQKAVIGYSGIYEEEDSPSRIASESDEYSIDVKIGLRNVEGVTQVIVEQTDEGYPVPFRYVVKDFQKGYFVANLDRELSAKLLVISFNKNGQVRSEAINIPALGYPEITKVSIKAEDNRLSIGGIPKWMKNCGKISYTISSALNPTSIIRGTLSDIGEVNISNLQRGIYVVSVFNNGNMIGSDKFIK